MRARRGRGGRPRRRRRTATSSAPSRWTSVTKLATAVAVLVAAEEGIVDLDEPAGPPGSTLRHLLAHASGLPFEGDAADRAAGRAADLLEHGLRARRGARRASAPRCRSPRTSSTCGASRSRARRRRASRRRSRRCSSSRASCSSRRGSRPRRSPRRPPSQFPGLEGVLPGFGRVAAERLGARLRAAGREAPALDGRRATRRRRSGTSAASGTFLWVDPEARLALACLTDLDFGRWAKEAWPRLADAVLSEAA